MKNKMSDLRNHLFVTIESMLDDDNPMDLERARAVSDVAQTIINSAKAETDFMRTAGRITGTDFIPLTDQRADVEA